MPVPVPPPAAPYVAPDLQLSASESSTTLEVYRTTSGRVVSLNFTALPWIEAHDAPFEIRLRRKFRGGAYGQQVFYDGGTKPELGAGDPTALRVNASGLDRADVSPTNWTTMRKFVHVEFATGSGTPVAAANVNYCPAGSVSRFDDPNGSEEPTIGGVSCPERDVYVLGRIMGIDRGWMSPMAITIPKSIASQLHAGSTYNVTFTINPDQMVAESSFINNSITLPAKVQARSGGAPADPCTLYDCFGALSARSMFEPRISQLRLGEPARDRALRDSERPQLARYARTQTITPRPAPQVTVHADGTTSAHSHDPAATQRMLGFNKPDPKVGSATPPGVDLPDLRSAPSMSVEAFSRRQHDYLAFSALTWNAGPGKLEVEAFGDGTGGPLTAYQVFYSGLDRATRQQRGVVIWHAPHKHFHFDSFARYDLVPTDSDTVLRTSGKNSWCIVDTNVVDSSLDHYNPSTFNLFSSPLNACGTERTARWARLTMSVGAGDLYSQSLPGQAFDITGLPNGMYRIRVTANPDARIGEASYANNVSYRRIRIEGRPGQARHAVAISNIYVNDDDSSGWFGY